MRYTKIKIKKEPSSLPSYQLFEQAHKFPYYK